MHLEAALETLNRNELEFAGADWPTWAHDAQLPPDDMGGPPDWSTWLILGGRGSGKTRAGAEWVKRIAGRAATRATPLRIALVGPSYAEAREVMVDGVSGLNALQWRGDRPQFVSSRRMLVWPDGSSAQLYSAEDPEELRGPQFDAAWCDGIQLLQGTLGRKTSGCCFAGLRWDTRTNPLRSTHFGLIGRAYRNLPVFPASSHLNAMFITGSCAQGHCVRN